MTSEHDKPRRILRTLPVVRRVAGLGSSTVSWRIVGWSRDQPEPKKMSAKFCDWSPVWLTLSDGRRFITEAWVLT